MLRPAEQIPTNQHASSRIPSDRRGRDNKHEAFERLKQLLISISGEINQDMAKYAEPGKTAFVAPDCTINMRAFKGKAGFDEASIGRDEAKIHESQIGFSSAMSPNVQAFHKVNTADGVIDKWITNKEKSLSNRLEMSVTGVFHKMLKSEFLVVRSSTYDDYYNGADTVIVNKETGDIICAIDEYNAEGDRSDAKQKKAQKTDNRGANLRYGLTFEKGAAESAPKLVVGPIRNIPVFYLKLTRDQLDPLLSGMDYSSTDRLAPVELEVFDKLTADLHAQASELKGKSTNPALAANLERAVNSVKRMIEIRQEKFSR
jgi:hypothetical protein